MAGGKGRIGFTLPEQRKPGRDSFDTKPRKVEAWIKTGIVMVLGQNDAIRSDHLQNRIHGRT